MEKSIIENLHNEINKQAEDWILNNRTSNAISFEEADNIKKAYSGGYFKGMSDITLKLACCMNCIHIHECDRMEDGACTVCEDWSYNPYLEETRGRDEFREKGNY